MTDLAKLIALAEKATPGPWIRSGCLADGRHDRDDSTCFKIRTMDRKLCDTKADREFMVALSPSVALSLLRELESSRFVIEQMMIEALNQCGTGNRAGDQDVLSLIYSTLGQHRNAYPSTTKAEGK